MQAHHSDVASVGSGVFAILALFLHFIAQSEPVLSGISAIVATVAGVVTVYYKLKNKQ